MIDGMLESAQDVSRNLQQAQPYGPHVLDDYTVGRVKQVYTTQLNDLWIYEKQLARWKQARPTAAQHKELERLTTQLATLRRVLTSTLALAEKLQEATIEKVLQKSDVEVALDVLSGKLKRP
jgi:hypothetical protein